MRNLDSGVFRKMGTEVSGAQCSDPAVARVRGVGFLRA